MYVGSTIRPLRVRISEHMRAIKQNDIRYPIAEHIHNSEKQGLNQTFTFLGIEVLKDPRGGNRELKLRRHEAKWVMRLFFITNFIDFSKEKKTFTQSERPAASGGFNKSQFTFSL